MFFDNFEVVEYVDTDGPEILGAKDVSINVGSTFNPLTGVTAVDVTDGAVTANLSVVIKNSLDAVVTTLDTASEGVFTVTYSVTDSLGNSSNKTITVTVITAPAPVAVKLNAPPAGVNHLEAEFRVAVGAYAGGTGYSGKLRFVWFIGETEAGSDLLDAPAPNGSNYLYETFLTDLPFGTYTVKFQAVGDGVLGLDSDFSIHTFEVTKAAPIEPGSNLLATTGADAFGWTEFSEGTGQLTLSEVNSKITIDVTGIGDADYKPHIFQTLSSLAIGEYRFTLKLDASVARHVRFNIVLPGAGYASIIGGPVNLLTTTGSTLEYELTFSVVNNLTNVKIELAFGNLGVDFISIPGTFTVKEVTFSEVDDTEAPAPGVPTQYSTGFEASEGFLAGTTYNNTTVAYRGPVEQQWGFYYGTPSTTGPVSGSQSAQMRWYTSAPNNKGYVFSDFDITNVHSISFKASNTNAINVQVTVSTDGGVTWINAEIFVLTTSTATYTYVVAPGLINENIRVKFEIVYTVAPTTTSRLNIDDILFINPS